MDKRHQGVRHIGVVLPSLSEFKELVQRIDAFGFHWITDPEKQVAKLSRKIGGKLTCPRGNVIEIKYYENELDYLG